MSSADVPSPPVEEQSATRGTGVRAGVAVLAGVLAVVGLTIAVLGAWTLRTATDSERFGERVEELLVHEEVSDALARRVVVEVADELEIRAAVLDITPDVVAPVADMVLAGVRARVEQQVAEAIRSDEVAGTVAAAAERAHRVAVAVLEGDDEIEGVAIEDGEVRVNLLPVTARAIETMQQVGLFAGADVPDLDRGGDPDEQRAMLGVAIGRDLPDDFGTPVVFESGALDRAGSTVELLRSVLLAAQRLVWLAAVLGPALAAASIWLSSNRWRTASWLVAGLFVVALVVRIVARRARTRVPDIVEQPGAVATVREIAAGLERSLNVATTGFATAALVVLVVSAIVVARREPA
jgi:hypothetical protein